MKIKKIVPITMCLIVGVWFSYGVTADFLCGTQTTTLSNVEVSKSQSQTGIFSLHYYLTGTSSRGERIRLEISCKNYSEISRGDTIKVEYYKNTGRIVNFLVY